MTLRKHTYTQFSIGLTLALALAVAIWSPVQIQAGEPTDGKKMMEGKKMEGCKEMMAQKQKMKEDMKAQDAQLTEQVSRMNNAPENRKMNLMAAIVTHMAEQRISMDARKAKMEEEMMKHMMQHMQMGKESMAQCPMMKEMQEKTADAHKDHQPK